MLLDFDKLAEVGEGGLHLGVGLGQGGLANSTVDEVVGEGGMGSDGRVAAKDRLIVAAVAVDGGGGASDAAALRSEDILVMM